MNKFKGTGVALVTPFTENGKLDYNGLEKLVKFQINNGVDYLVVQGTTGESVTLNDEEKVAVLEYIIEINAKRLPILLGVGGNNTAETTEKIKYFSNYEIDGFLSVSPYYNKPSQMGIYQHYKEISLSSNLPIILYNVPGRTSSNISPETTLRLANDFTNIIGIKEASGNLEQIMMIISKKPENFLVISGDDALTLPHISVGGDGVISVIANAFPKRFSSMVQEALNGNLDIAREKHYELLEIIHYLFIDGNPSGIKYLLKLINICSESVRLPLVKLSKTTATKIYELVAGIDDTLV
ncbi:MAG: 4-hydroxy-tetrahydrodipicolinate synthase [Bacteroidetes bacterium MED-G20]|nr:MAG: 4-hydroxy-tetrahydrodipicolinate synthase [Bacteroidetes bacterium MED-G20]|tara:strand:- start:2205 stop:3095 length:891 start_codon:yes stop_codon:yes gene_type:complete